MCVCVCVCIHTHTHIEYTWKGGRTDNTPGKWNNHAITIDFVFRNILGALKRAILLGVKSERLSLGALTTDTAGELDVFRHDGDTLGVDSAQVRVLEKTDQVSFASLLKCHDGRTLETQVGLEVLCDLADQTLEWQLADQQLGALLVTTDLTQSYGTWPVTMGLLHATSSRSTLTCRLRGQLLPWSLSSGRLSSGLLRTCHLNSIVPCLLLLLLRKTSD